MTLYKCLKTSESVLSRNIKPQEHIVFFQRMLCVCLVFKHYYHKIKRTKDIGNIPKPVCGIHEYLVSHLVFQLSSSELFKMSSAFCTFARHSIHNHIARRGRISFTFVRF